MNVVSRLAAKPPAFGGTDLALSSLPKSEKGALTNFVHTRQLSEKKATQNLKLQANIQTI